MTRSSKSEVEFAGILSMNLHVRHTPLVGKLRKIKFDESVGSAGLIASSTSSLNQPAIAQKNVPKSAD
jgi:hypothetical protein